jgi:hypothetical protein
MNLLRILIGTVPKWIVLLLLVTTFVFGSHAGLDYLVAAFGDSCIPLDASTEICLVPTVE